MHEFNKVAKDATCSKFSRKKHFTGLATSLASGHKNERRNEEEKENRGRLITHVHARLH